MLQLDPMLIEADVALGLNSGEENVDYGGRCLHVSCQAVSKLPCAVRVAGENAVAATDGAEAMRWETGM